MNRLFSVALLLILTLAFASGCGSRIPEGYALVTVTPATSVNQDGEAATVNLPPTATGGAVMDAPIAPTAVPATGDTPATDPAPTAPVDTGTAGARDPNLALPTEGRIAFMGPVGNNQGTLSFIANADGSGIVPVTESLGDMYYPSLAPDGQRVAVVASGERSSDIFVIDVATGEATNLTDLAGEDNYPVYSPDGSQIAFVSDREGGDVDLWVMNADGTEPRRIARTPGRDEMGSWHPDGENILFANQNELGKFLYTVNVASGDFAQLLESDEGTEDAGPVYSPDGSQIAFFRFANDSYTVYTADGDGANVTQITDGVAPAVFPRYSPDGNWLLYTNLTQDQRQELVALDLESNATAALPNVQGLATSWVATSEVLADTGYSQGPRLTGVEVDAAVLEAAYKIGDPNAPIQIIEFSDYQCSFCQSWYNSVWPQLQPYIEDGTVQVTYVDFPLSIHPQAPAAAEAARCVGELGGTDAYWRMHNSLFENIQTWSVGQPAPVFSQMATDLGLDGNAVAECVTSGRYAAEVQAGLAEGSRLLVDGTPTFFINGDRIIGAQPWSAFERYLTAVGGQ